MNRDEREIGRKLRVLERAEATGNDAKAYRYFGIPKSTFYRWRDLYRKHGEQGLVIRKPVACTHPNRTPDKIVEKILSSQKVPPRSYADHVVHGQIS